MEAWRLFIRCWHLRSAAPPSGALGSGWEQPWQWICHGRALGMAPGIPGIYGSSAFPFPFPFLRENLHPLPRKSSGSCSQTELRAEPGWKEGKKLIKNGKKASGPVQGSVLGGNQRCGWRIQSSSQQIQGFLSVSNTQITPTGKMNPPGVSRFMDQPFPPCQVATATPSQCFQYKPVPGWYRWDPRAAPKDATGRGMAAIPGQGSQKECWTSNTSKSRALGHTHTELGSNPAANPAPH